MLAMANDVQEQGNFSRIARIVLNVCTASLRDLLSSMVPPSECKIPAGAVHLRILNNSQRNIIGNISKALSYDECDITLLYILIRNISPIIPPTQGWGRANLEEYVNEADINVGDDVERIRILRNKLLIYSSSAKLPTVEFNYFLEELKGIMRRFDCCHMGTYPACQSTGTYLKGLNEILNTQMEPALMIYYNNQLQMNQNGMLPPNTLTQGESEVQPTPVMNKPVPKPRPRVLQNDEKPPQTRPIPPPRKSSNTLPRRESTSQPKNMASIESLPGFRKSIEDLIKEGRPQKEKFHAACNVMRVECSLNSKYESIELLNILERNKGQDVRRIPQAFTILERYATNLLKDESQRHPSWSSVQFTSNIYQNKVKFLQGAVEILKSLGYTEEIFNMHGDLIGVSFLPGASPNSRIVINIAVDLVIAQFEVEAMIMGEHPRANELQMIEDVPAIYFPAKKPIQNTTSDQDIYENLPKKTISTCSAQYENKPVQDIVTDNNRFEKETVDYALSKPFSSMPDDELDYDVPPPELPPKRNNSQKSLTSLDSPITQEYKKLLSSTRIGESGDQIHCFKCGTTQDPKFKFCSECGSPLKNRTSSECSSEASREITNSVKNLSMETDDDFVHIDEEGWNCDHCTLLNSYDTNVCVMCYRTSSSIRNAKPTPTINNTSNDVSTQSPTQTQLLSLATHLQSTVGTNTQIPSNSGSSANMFQTLPNQSNMSSVQLDEMKLQEARKRREDELQQIRLKELHEAEVKKQSIIKGQNELKQNAQLLVSLVKIAENHGYTIDECLLAQKLLNNINEQILLQWLQNDWSRLIDDVVKLCTEYFQKDESVGAMSRGEAKQLLLQVDGNKLEVIKPYAEKRKSQITKLADLEKRFSRQDVLDALFDADGCDEKARRILQKRMLQVFHQNMNNHFIPEDYDRLKDESIPYEVRRRMVMAEMGVSWGRADFFFRLMKKGVPGSAAEILEVIKNNTIYNYEQCVKFFTHECQTCLTEFSHNNIYVGLYCKCELCWECYSNHIKVIISERHIRNLVCPACFKPDIEDTMIDRQQYFGMFATQINHLINKGLLEANIKESFDNKLLDYHLKKSVNFRYCIKCKNGFEWEDINQIRMECDKCQAKMCFLCKEEWMDQHDGISCDDFKEWKEANDPSKQEKGVQELLHGRGIECPDCKVKFELAQGGCMHFVCTECRYEFCSGCNQPFKRDGQCAVHETCVGKGIHTHHPRDCLYYMRDFEVQDLETLLNNHQVEWKREYPPEMQGNDERVCGVALQKEVGDALKDEPCGEVAPENMSGLCQKHYKEYLVVLINNNSIDPIEVMDVERMNTVLQRAFKQKLPKNNGESDEDFEARLKVYVLKEVPLPPRHQRRNTPHQGNANVLGAAAAAAAVPDAIGILPP